MLSLERTKKRSVFFEPLYWFNLDVRLYLNVVYMEKHGCDSVIWIYLKIQDKTKDCKNVHLDRMEKDTLQELALEE